MTISQSKAEPFSMQHAPNFQLWLGVFTTYCRHIAAADFSSMYICQIQLSSRLNK